MKDVADVYVIDTSFVSNEAGSGGAIAFASTVGTAGGFERCAFDNNSADNGGALHTTSGNASDTGTIIFVRDSVLHHNFARENNKKKRNWMFLFGARQLPMCTVRGNH